MTRENIHKVTAVIALNAKACKSSTDRVNFSGDFRPISCQTIIDCCVSDDCIQYKRTYMYVRLSLSVYVNLSYRLRCARLPSTSCSGCNACRQTMTSSAMTSLPPDKSATTEDARNMATSVRPTNRHSDVTQRGDRMCFQLGLGAVYLTRHTL